jgi:hypothetical protein
MIRLHIRDVEVEDEMKGTVYCEDDAGDRYKIPTTYKKAKMIALLLAEAYVRQGNIYEFIIDLFNSSNLYIDYLLIKDGKEAKAQINIIDSDNNRKSFYITIPDALILSLLSKRELYINKQAEFVFIDELEDVAWYRFLKELDLCR